MCVQIATISQFSHQSKLRRNRAKQPVRTSEGRLVCVLTGIRPDHRLRGSASPVLTATHHSYGSPILSDFFPSRLWGSDPSTTCFHAKWPKRRAFTQGCAFCSKNRNFSYTLISRAPKRSKFRKLFARFGL